MNGNSKREKVDEFIRRCVYEAVKQIAWNATPEDIAVLRRHVVPLTMVSANVITEAYRFKELQDILAWKKPPTE